MLLPETFIEKYRHLLGSEADAFLASFDDEPVSGFRVNPLKPVQVTFNDPIPNTPWGYYGKVNGKSSEHVSGLVYSHSSRSLSRARSCAIATLRISLKTGTKALLSLLPE